MEHRAQEIKDSDELVEIYGAVKDMHKCRLKENNLLFSKLREERDESKRQNLHHSNIMISPLQIDGRPPQRKALTISTPLLSPKEGKANQIVIFIL